MNERSAILAHFRAIDRDDVIAMEACRAGGEQSEGHEMAEEIARERGISSPTWVFWHQQSAWAFGGDGNLVAPLLVHWGGDHDRAAALLADLPFPLRVIDGGSDGAFQIVSDAAPGRLAEPFPPVTDTPAVKDRIRRVTAQRRKDSEWSDAEVDWMNAVLRGGDRAAQGYVVRHLAGSERISEEAYETLLGDWARIYVKAPKDVLVWDMLRTMERRGDPRRDEVIETCMRRPRWTFSSGVGHFLAERQDPADLDRLRELALTPCSHPSIPGNGAALQGWVQLRATLEQRSAADVAADALTDPAFDEGARRTLHRIA